MGMKGITVLAGTSLAVLLLLPLLARLADGRSTAPDGPNQERPAETREKHAAASSAPAASDPVSQPVMTRAQFDRIRPGMSYEECLNIIGTAGTPIAPEECRAKGITAGYRWLDPQGKVEFELAFRNGKVAGMGFGQPRAIGKQMAAQLQAAEASARVLTEAEVRQAEQAAVQQGTPVVVTMAEFERIKSGMTYDECVAIIGQQNPMAAQYAGPRNAALAGQGTLTESYKWPNPGGYYAEISFSNGRVTNKIWKKGGAPTGGSARGSGGRPPAR